MKHKLLTLLVCIAVCYSNIVPAQSYNNAPQPPNFQVVNKAAATLAEIVDSMRAAASPNDTGEGEALDEISQFKSFWQGRQ